jgi:hypothetical protein
MGQARICVLRNSALAEYDDAGGSRTDRSAVLRLESGRR